MIKTSFMKKIALAAALTFSCAFSSMAQNYPQRVVTIVVPFAAGGPGDALARILGQYLGIQLNGSVIIENVAGAGGTIGTQRVAKASPDGYTLLFNHIGHATAPALYPKLGYNSLTDFAPIGIVTDLTSVFVARKNLEATSFPEFISYLKANKEKVSYAHAGIGSASHLCGLLLMDSIGVQLNQIPYRGTGPAMNDLVGEKVDVSCDQIVNVVSGIEGKIIKAYAVTSKTPSAAAPTLPTADKAGLPNFDLSIWYGLWSTKDTPKDIVDALQKALQATLASPEAKAKFALLGAATATPDRANSAALHKHVESEIEKWGSLIKKMGVATQ